MQISVLYFGILKERSGRECESLQIPESSRVEDLAVILRQRSALGDPQLWQSLAIAVNREYVSGQHPLRDGDEVALLPPVSGGSRAR